MTEDQVLNACRELNKTSFAKMKKSRYILNVPVCNEIDENENKEYTIAQTPARMIMPGLAITEIVRTTDEQKEQPIKYGFTHTKSGRILHFGNFKSERSALIKANKCKMLKEIDWCQAACVISNDPKFEEISNYFLK